MKKSFLNKMEKKLKQELKEIVQMSEGQDLTVDNHGDETDQIQANLIMYLDSQLGSRQKNKIKQIDEALQKIESGDYGTCEDCEEDIPEKRLEFNPYFLTCVRCAEMREKESKQTR